MTYRPGATTAEIVAESAVAKPVRPDRVRYSPGVAKAWARYSNSSGLTVTNSYNVTSVTDNGVGVATLNLTNPVTAALAVATGGQTAARSFTVAIVSTTAIQVTGVNSTTGAVDDMGTNCVVVYGDL